jgi:large subunit ribosomal protein L13
MMLMGGSKEDYKDYVVYDAKDRVLGRLASTVAKELLNGKKVAVVNAERAFITGNKKVIAKRYRVRLNLQEKENPEHSPYWPRRSDMLVRRIIRGMLPYHKKPSGKAAFKRLRVFVGMPKELNGFNTIKVDTKEPKSMYVGYVYVGDLSKLLGYNKIK